MFGEWEWSECTSKLAFEQQKEKLLKAITGRIYEDTMVERLKNRSFSTKRKLKLRRTLLMLVSVFVLILGFYLIVLAALYENLLAYEVAKISILKPFSNIIPEVALSLINMSVGYVISWITHFERWDYISTHLIVEMSRLYIVEMFDFLIFVLINIEIVAEISIL